MNGNGRVAYSDASSDTTSNRSESSNLRLAAMTPQHAPRLQGSVASSVLAEATEASLLDSLADGTSSIDEGSLVDSIRGNR